MPMLLAAALALSEGDRSDLRCVWVAQDAVQYAKPELRETLVQMASWYAGRISVTQPGLGVQGYVQTEFVDEKPTELELKSWTSTYMTWLLREFESSARR